MLRRGSPVVDDQFVAGTKNVVSAYRNAQGRLVGSVVPGGAVAEERGAKALELGLVDNGLGVEIAHGRQIAQGILLLLCAFLRRPHGARLSAACTCLRARLGLATGCARQRGRLWGWLLAKALSRRLVRGLVRRLPAAEAALLQLIGHNLAHAVIAANLAEQPVVGDVFLRNAVATVTQLAGDLCLGFGQHVGV